MIFFIAGIPGWFATRCEALTAELVRRVLGTTELLRCDTLDETSVALLRGTVSHPVVASTQPNEQMRAALLKADIRFLVVQDDPLVGLAQTVAGGELDLISGTRVVANSCAAISVLRRCQQALVLESAESQDHLQRTALLIARHFGLSLPEDEIRDTAEAVAAREKASGLGSDRDNVPFSETRLPGFAIDALAAYRVQGDHDQLQTICWAPDLFLRSEDGKPAVGTIDITGRPRQLIAGPNIMLEPGAWSLSMGISFSLETAEHEFSIEITGCEPAERRIFHPGRGGLLQGAIDITIPERMEPLAIQLISERAAFEGTVKLAGARLIRSQSSGTSGASRLLFDRQ